MPLTPSLLILVIAFASTTADPGAGALEPQQRGRGLGASQDKGLGGLFGSAKSKIGRNAGPTVFDQDRFRAELEQLKAKTNARQLQRRELQMDLVDEAQVQEWFVMSDHDRNGWISFGEARHSLSFSRPRFRAFDGNSDGRLDAFEFDELYMHSIVNIGRFAPPEGAPSDTVPPTRSPIQLRNAYDEDLDRAIGRLELGRALADYSAGGDAEAILEELDTSGDLKLDLEELNGLREYLFPVTVPTVAAEGDGPALDSPATVDDLFGEVTDRRGGIGSIPSPPRILGPVGHFRRLDLDNDGYISLQDLESLLRPVRSSIRPHTVINTLDTDGDFRLSEQEFLGSLAGLPLGSSER